MEDANKMTERDYLLTEIEHLKEQLALSEEELNKAMHRSTEWESEVYALRERCKCLEDNLAAERDRFRKMSELEGETSRMNNVLKSESTSLKTENNRLNSEIERIKEKTVETVRMATHSEAVLMDMEEENEALKTAIGKIMVWVGRELKGAI